MFSEQLEHFFGFFGVDLEEENSNIFESLFLSTSNFANFRIPAFLFIKFEIFDQGWSESWSGLQKIVFVSSNMAGGKHGECGGTTICGWHGGTLVCYLSRSEGPGSNLDED